ncbi:hypothetical protein [Shewanella sp. SR43-8]|uniref:hypothetical protein n=1 Tax=Shewanella sp. SR43-8 TaxID=2760938 RepID=UPI00160499B7|nr:hypothetical protein [Shewanella sp. SR43-8]MBB1322020.1 hypothetical protein [Shewanella sp. SR43-8]
MNDVKPNKPLLHESDYKHVYKKRMLNSVGNYAMFNAINRPIKKLVVVKVSLAQPHPPVCDKHFYSALCKNKSITLGKFLTFIHLNAYLIKIRLNRLN